MQNLHGILHGMQWIIFHGLPDSTSCPPQRGGSNTKLRDRDISKSHDVFLKLIVWKGYLIRMVMK